MVLFWMSFLFFSFNYGFFRKVRNYYLSIKNRKICNKFIFLFSSEFFFIILFSVVFMRHIDYGTTFLFFWNSSVIIYRFIFSTSNSFYKLFKTAYLRALLIENSWSNFEHKKCRAITLQKLTIFLYHQEWQFFTYTFLVTLDFSVFFSFFLLFSLFWFFVILSDYLQLLHEQLWWGGGFTECPLSKD